jgi:hypothetical protein
MQIKDILSRNYVEVSLCALHHPCSLVRSCISGGSKVVFDFDQVTKDYRQHKKMPSCASVDALTENKDTICFVEMKGWKDFLDHTANISEYKIQKQAAKYNLAYKLSCSIETCIGLLCDEAGVGAESDFLSTSKCYIVVTDINIQQDPLISLASNLNLLAETASDWETICWKHLKEKVEQVKGMKTLFVSCRDFDSLFI